MMLRPHIFAVLFIATLWNTTIADDQVAPAAENELPCVIRVSYVLLDELVDDQVEAQIPFQSPMLGGQVWGSVNGRARLVVDLQESASEATFIISATGNAAGCAYGRRACLRVSANVWVPFSATQVVRFDGDKFTVESLHVQSCPRAQLTAVTTKRSSAVGDLIGGAVRPCVNHMIPEAERQAIPVANRYLGQFVQKEANAVVAELNQITPVEAALREMYPELKEWRYRLSATETHLVAAYGPPGGAFPKLPTPPEPLPEARIEVWVRTTPEEAAFLQSMAQWNISNDLMKEFLLDEPELEELLEDATVTAVENWVRVGIGSDQQ
jgi:hypothetical protein